MEVSGSLQNCPLPIVLLVPVLLVSVGARSDPGWTAHLLCSCLQDKDILGMMITTPDLPDNEYCFFIRDGHEQPKYQNAAFAGRMFGTGGPNVTMKEVTSSDEVQYTCRGWYKGPGNETKETMCPANLTLPGGPTPRPPGLPEIALIVLAYVIIGVTVVIVVRRCEIRIFCTKTEEKRDAPVKFYHDKRMLGRLQSLIKLQL
ncbi:uncharacterized protein LOC121504412 [Cheilinus undulatus]|uniref:uncharacterized protein LOC121504412 n=1 Tax=Cheilinus undulatus TaxID=241271 RepID=UPI001BD5011D|nr:uncharacterized protein LOC121504412 [Cheilinus undulatus]